MGRLRMAGHILKVEVREDSLTTVVFPWLFKFRAVSNSLPTGVDSCQAVPEKTHKYQKSQAPAAPIPRPWALPTSPMAQLGKVHRVVVKSSTRSAPTRSHTTATEAPLASTLIRSILIPAIRRVQPKTQATMRRSRRPAPALLHIRTSQQRK